MNKTITQLKESHQAFAIATIVKTSGSVPREVGAKMLIFNDENNYKFEGTVGGGALESLVIEDAKDLLSKGKSELKEYDLSEADQVCGGKAQVFIEVEMPKIPLYLFGAGHVGQALCRVLKDTVFDIHLIDEREEWTTQACHVRKFTMPWDTFCQDALWNHPFVIIMTHDHKHDNQILEYSLQKEFRYLGLMGSRTKWYTFKEELLGKGFSKKQLDEVHCPVGNKKVGRGPAEIAISIANEILLEL